MESYISQRTNNTVILTSNFSKYLMYNPLGKVFLCLLGYFCCITEKPLFYFVKIHWKLKVLYECGTKKEFTIFNGNFDENKMFRSNYY